MTLNLVHHISYSPGNLPPVPRQWKDIDGMAFGAVILAITLFHVQIVQCRLQGGGRGIYKESKNINTRFWSVPILIIHLSLHRLDLIHRSEFYCHEPRITTLLNMIRCLVSTTAKVRPSPEIAFYEKEHALLVLGASNSKTTKTSSR